MEYLGIFTRFFLFQKEKVSEFECGILYNIWEYYRPLNGNKQIVSLSIIIFQVNWCGNQTGLSFNNKPGSIFSHGSSLTLPKIVMEKCWNSTVLHGHSGNMVTRILTRMRTLLTGQVRQIKLLISTVSSTLPRTLHHFQPVQRFHYDPLLLFFFCPSP